MSSIITPMIASIEEQVERLADVQMQLPHSRFNLDVDALNLDRFDLGALSPREQPLLVVTREGLGRSHCMAGGRLRRLLNYMEDLDGYGLDQSNFPTAPRLTQPAISMLGMTGIKVMVMGFDPIGYQDTSVYRAAEKAKLDGVRLAGSEVIQALLWSPDYRYRLDGSHFDGVLLGGLQFRRPNSNAIETPLLRSDYERDRLVLSSCENSSRSSRAYSRHCLPTVRQLPQH